MRVALLSCLLICAVCTNAAGKNNAICIKVLDADTIIVRNTRGTSTRIRLIGIDAPEKGQPYGINASRVLEHKIRGENITFKSRSIDSYGRTLADVYMGDRWINNELVAEGWAWHYKKYSTDKTLAKAERQARSKRLGLWKGKNPLSPWTFRKKRREKK